MDEDNFPAQCHPLIKSKKKKQNEEKMKQCKLCGSPLGKEPTTEELENHWKKHHNWHWESNNEKTPQEALLKKSI
jgi:hypothetical protein